MYTLTYESIPPRSRQAETGCKIGSVRAIRIHDWTVSKGWNVDKQLAAFIPH